jgi:hypothetical protein
MLRKKREEESAQAGRDAWSSTGFRIAVGGAVAFGALASGFLISRRGRRLVADTFRGRQRTQLADRVLDRFWEEPALGRRRLDVEEQEEGVVEVLGSVATDWERSLALQVARSVPGVHRVRDRLVLDPSIIRRRARSGKDLARGH